MALEKIVTYRVTLELNERELVWLKTMVQNPMNDQNPKDEHPDEKSARLKLWKALGGRVRNETAASFDVDDLYTEKEG